MAPPFSRFVVFPVMIACILSVCWFEFAGKIRPLLSAYVFAYAAFVLAFPAYSSIQPLDFWGILRHGQTKVVYFNPSLPENPQPDLWKVYEISDTIANHYNTENLWKYDRINIISAQSDEFAMCKNTSGEKRKDSNFSDLYFQIIHTLTWYKMAAASVRIPIFIKVTDHAAEALNEIKPYPVYLIDCRDLKEKHENTPDKIYESTGRKAVFFKSFVVNGKKCVDLYFLQPEKAFIIESEGQ
jgi:hypothetical protein